MEPLTPALDAPERGVAVFLRSAGLMVRRLIERGGVTLATGLILLLALAVAIHFPDRGLPPHHFRGR
jgi:hypothetical protein